LCCGTGDFSINVPPYKSLRGIDVKEMKTGKQKVSMIKKIKNEMHNRGAQQLRFDHMMKKSMTTRDALDLYHATKHLIQYRNGIKET